MTGKWSVKYSKLFSVSADEIAKLKQQLTVANARADELEAELGAYRQDGGEAIASIMAEAGVIAMRNRIEAQTARADATQQKLNDLIQWIRDMLNHWDEHEDKT